MPRGLEGRGSTATDGDDDFDAITCLQAGVGVLCFRHQLAVAFYSEPLACEAHLIQQLADRERLIEASKRTVYCDFTHVGEPNWCR